MSNAEKYPNAKNKQRKTNVIQVCGLMRKDSLKHFNNFNGYVNGDGMDGRTCEGIISKQNENAAKTGYV